jgi:hypothetical protein
VVPSPMPQLSGNSAGSPSKPLARSKSRGGSVGGFVHGIVNGVQASLRNVGHKSAQSSAYLFCTPFLLFPLNLCSYLRVYLGWHNMHVTCGSPFQWISLGPPTTIQTWPFQDQSLVIAHKFRFARGPISCRSNARPAFTR